MDAQPIGLVAGRRHEEVRGLEELWNVRAEPEEADSGAQPAVRDAAFPLP